MMEFLTHNVNSDYRFIKLSSCVYHAKNNTAVITFYYSEKIADNLETLQDRLEREYRAKIAEEVKLVFEYKKSYTDELLLQMEVKKFLTRNFSILTLSLDDEDIHAQQIGDTFKINLHVAPQSIDYIKNNKTFAAFVRKLHDESFCEFEFFFDVKKTNEQDDIRALEKLEKYMKDTTAADGTVKVDKSLRVKNVEYWLGKPIKERPVKVEFIRVSGEEQTTAGEIKFLTKREYTPRVIADASRHSHTPRGHCEHSEAIPRLPETRVYWTFVLDDTKHRLQCVFFPTDKTLSKFEKLVNGTVVCVTGINSERNGRTSFRVNGVSFCEMLH